MKSFNCVCGQNVALFFESSQCTHCGRLVGYCPDLSRAQAFDPAPGGDWCVAGAAEQRYRQCGNYREHAVCNWMVPAADPQPLCRACRLNEIIPDLSVAPNLLYWAKLETAKRRTLYTLLELGLPLASWQEDPQRGLRFRFMTDKLSDSEFTAPLQGQAPIYTGHEAGLITIDLAEADDIARTRAKLRLGEAYRTPLGHFRHELGHYYWDRLVAPEPARLQAFRERFGDEREDYQAALARHYRDGAAPGWQERCISAYAAVHPWEDWAECWAHYLHMIDTLETAQAFQLQFGGQPVPSAPLPQAGAGSTIDGLFADWIRLAVGLNALNRSMGEADAYPFVLIEPVMHKLRWVHQLIEETRQRP